MLKDITQRDYSELFSLKFSRMNDRARKNSTVYNVSSLNYLAKSTYHRTQTSSYLKMRAFWDTQQCSLIEVDGRFRYV